MSNTQSSKAVIPTAGAAPVPRTATKRLSRRNLQPTWLGLASVLLILVLWQVMAALVIRNEGLLPLPSSVWTAFLVDIGNGSLWVNAGASLQRVAIGFVIAVITAIPVGFILGWYPRARSMAEPVIQFLRVIPPIAIIPLVIVYLGIGEAAKDFLIWYSAFLTIVISVYGGVRALDATLIRAGRVLGAKDLDIFLDIAVPASVPFIFVGMRLGLAAAWSTLVAAELIASSEGLGFLIIQSGQYRDLARVILGIAVIGIIGLLMDRLILLFDTKLTHWQEREQR